MSQAEELRHQASSSSHEVDQDQEEEGQLGDQMDEVSNKTTAAFVYHMIC